MNDSDNVSTFESEFVERSANVEQMAQGVRYSDMRNKLAHAALERARRTHASRSSFEVYNQSTDLEAQIGIDSQDQPGQDNQVASQANNRVSMHQVIEDRRRNIEASVSLESWYTVFGQPTDQWDQRKCNLWLNFFAALAVLASDNKECGIPVTTWLSVYFFMLMFEVWQTEMRQRMSDSHYWNSKRKLKKVLVNGGIIIKEIFDLAWVIYGSTLYWSEAAKGCGKNGSGFMTVMFLFIFLGLIKIFLFVVVLAVIGYIMVQRKLKKRNDRLASVDVLRSLQSVRFNALSQADPDEECIICYIEYKDEDIVTRLRCNEKHIFHSECIGHWIREGKNTCPVCRAPITDLPVVQPEI